MERRRRVSIGAGAVVFDLDGTLIHSAPDLMSAANAVCRSRDWQDFDLETIISFIGNGIPKLVARVFEARGASTQEADYQTAVMDFLAFYDAHATDLTTPYEGVVEALEQLRQKGVALGVVTNKPIKPTMAILGALGLEDYFDAVIGGDSTPAKKPDPAPYLAVCEQLGVEVADTIYIGDSETDAKTAQGVNVPFVLFTGGYRTTAVEEIIHWRKFDKFSQLMDVLQPPAN